VSALDLVFVAPEMRERMPNVGPPAVLQPPRSAKAYAYRLMNAMKRQPVGAPSTYRPHGRDPALQQR
jgi:hypothetical protein